MGGRDVGPLPVGRVTFFQPTDSFTKSYYDFHSLTSDELRPWPLHFFRRSLY